MLTRPAVIVALTGAIAAAGATMAAAPRQAVAQSRGTFGSLFGSFSHDDRFAPPDAYRASAYAPADLPARPRQMPQLPADSWAGHTTWCVRLCDGRYFPLTGAAANSRASATQMCSALCPAAKTAVFRGGAIDEARSTRGERYADLDNAFVYRERVVPDCTCNGRDAFGLAKIDVNNDPTLRAGDIVATSNGLAVFRGGRGETHRAANFTPIGNVSSLAADIRRTLLGARVSRGE